MSSSYNTEEYTKDDYYKEREQLEEVIRRGDNARVELDVLDHRFGWAEFSMNGIKSGLDKLED